MKNSKFLVSCAVAGMLLGAQAALAEEVKPEEGKNGCKGKDGKHQCKSEDGKASCKGKDAKKKVEGAHACSGPNGCDGKEEEK